MGKFSKIIKKSPKCQVNGHLASTKVKKIQKDSHSTQNFKLGKHSDLKFMQQKTKATNFYYETDEHTCSSPFSKINNLNKTPGLRNRDFGKMF